MKFGFIGSGNMATAIIKGALSSGNFNSQNIFAYDLDSNKTLALKNELGIIQADSLQSLIDCCDAVILSVKPNVFASLLPSVSTVLSKKNPLIISIAAGKTIDFISNLLTYDARIIRVMPNINATVNEAMSAYCFNENVTQNDKQFCEKLCSSFGKVMCLDENYFSLFGVVAGCAPAYAYMFIDSLARAAVKNGMNKKDALQIAAQTVYGSAKQIMESGLHPWELTDRVCSPGGTTIEGVAALQENGFESTITKAVEAALDKDKKV